MKKFVKPMPKNNDFTINLQYQLKKEKYDDDKVVIQLSSTQIEIYYYQLCKYSQLIQSQYLKNDAQERLSHDLQLFQREFDIKDSNIITFFKIIKDENVKITNDQYYDLFKLSEMFKVRSLQNLLKEYSKRNFNDVSFIINSILNGNSVSGNENDIQSDSFLTHLEELLSDQIEECLKNKHFGDLNISILHRIIENSFQKKLIKTNSLYEFIRESVDKRFVLFSFIDIQDLSEENFNDLYNDFLKRKSSNSQSIYDYLPIDLSYINKLKQDKKEIQNKLEILNQNQSNTTNLQNQIDQLKEENNRISQYQNQIDHLKEENNKISQYQDQINQLEEENKQLKDQIKKGHLIVPKFVKREIKFPKKDQVEIKKTTDVNSPIEKELNFNIIKAILDNYEKQIKNQNQNKTLLHLGCESQNVQVVKYILAQKNIDINKEFTENNVTKNALHIAVEKNDINIVKLLLEQPTIDVNFMSRKVTYTSSTSSNNDNYYSGGYYSNSNNIKSTTTIKQNSSTQEAPLHIAVKNDFIEIVQLLLNHRNTDVNILSKSKSEENRVRNDTPSSYSTTKNPHSSFSKTKNNTVEKTALLYAIENQNSAIVDLLLSHQNINVNASFKDYTDESSYNDSTDDIGRTISKSTIYHIKEKTPLYCAVENEKTELVMKLLSHPNIDINAYFKNNTSQNSSSSYSKNNATNSYSNNYANNSYISNPYSSESSSTTTKEDTILKLAINKKNIEIVQLLLSMPNIDVNLVSKDNSSSKSTTNFYSNNNNDITSSNSSSDDKILEKTALHLAVEKNSIEIIQLLLAHKDINVNTKIENSTIYDSGKTKNESNALYMAVEKKYIEIVQLLLEHPNIDVNIKMEKSESKKSKKESNALYMAVENKSIEIVQLLLEHHNIDVNIIMEKSEYQKSKNESSALFLAVENKDSGIVQLLLEHPNIDVNIKYHNIDESTSKSDEKTAIYLSVEKNDVEITKLLLTNQNIDLNIPYKSGSKSGTIDIEKAPLYLAVENGNIEIVRALLTNKNIDVNMFSKSTSSSSNPYSNKCCTALHLAVEGKTTEIIKLLLKHEKIDINIKDNNNNTPIDLMNGNQILSLLSSQNNK